MRLAQRAGLRQSLHKRPSVPSPNAATKAGCVLAGMIAGADSIDDLDVLRHGGTSKVVTRWGAGDGWDVPAGVHVRLVKQLDVVSSQMSAG